MINNFERQFKKIESELIALKTTKEKSASDLKLATHSIALSLTLNSNGFAQKMFRVNSSSSPVLFTATLDKGDEDDGREFLANKYYDANGELIHIQALGNSDDQSKAAGGETVVLNTTLTVVATDEVECTEVSFS